MTENALIKKINRYFHDEEAAFFEKRHRSRIDAESLFYKSFFEGYFKGKEHADILDIGTGTGLVPSSLNAGKYNFICSDISFGMLNKTRQSNENRGVRLGYIISDAENLPFKAGTFDIVTCNAAMHHFPSIESFAGEAGRVLKDGGFLVIGFEANRKFWANRPLSLLYRIIARIGGASKAGPSYEAICRRVNERLLSDKTIGKPLPVAELLKYVDIHSPNAGKKIDPGKGFDIPGLVKGVFKGYEAKIIYHYKERPRAAGTVNKVFFPACAPQFSLILKKLR